MHFVHHKVVCVLWKICFRSCLRRMEMSSVFHRFFYILESLESMCNFCNISANGSVVNLP